MKDSGSNGSPTASLPQGAASAPLQMAAGKCRLRFLGAADGYSPVWIWLGERCVAQALPYGSLTTYLPVKDGFHSVTVYNAAGQALIHRQLPLRAGDAVTLALIETPNGLELLPVSDIPCVNIPRGLSCLRLCNLAPDSAPLGLSLLDGRCVFTHVRFCDATSFKTIRSGDYGFTLLSGQETPPDIETVEGVCPPSSPARPMIAFTAHVHSSVLYTAYVLGHVGGAHAAPHMLLVADSLGV